MPNHVINELIFRNVDVVKQAELLSVLCDEDHEVDFSILVPAPLNMWWGSVGSLHEKAFGRTRLDWAHEQWGTKWNAYSHHPVERTDDTMILRFETAWRPPYPWLAAVFNKFVISFDHNWFDEGAERGVAGRFDAKFHQDDMKGEPWKEQPASDELHHHLHKLHFGVEEFDDEDAA